MSERQISIKVNHLGKMQDITLPENATGIDIVKAINEPPDSILLLKNEEPFLIKENVDPASTYRIIKVASGG